MIKRFYLRLKISPFTIIQFWTARINLELICFLYEHIFKHFRWERRKRELHRLCGYLGRKREKRYVLSFILTCRIYLFFFTKGDEICKCIFFISKKKQIIIAKKLYSTVCFSRCFSYVNYVMMNINEYVIKNPKNSLIYVHIMQGDLARK